MFLFVYDLLQVTTLQASAPLVPSPDLSLLVTTIGDTDLTDTVRSTITTVTRTSTLTGLCATTTPSVGPWIAGLRADYKYVTGSDKPTRNTYSCRRIILDLNIPSTLRHCHLLRCTVLSKELGFPGFARKTLCKQTLRKSRHQGRR
jgi:hypothetical protein